MRISLIVHHLSRQARNRFSESFVREAGLNEVADATD
jgi:hypothetical protein